MNGANTGFAPTVARDDSPWHTGSGVHREHLAGWLMLAAVWVVSAVYLGLYLRRVWVPPDAGMLSQMAERVLRGQLPDRGFIEVYTGGLTYLNALAFRLFGVNFFSLRIMLFLFFLGWVPSVYFVARRFTRPLAASAVTLLAVVWSVPNYPEAMPSWYNLFFATWGMLALLRYAESEKKRWLWIAGLCGGLSFLIKISGLYFVAAALLFFIFREQTLANRLERKGRSKGWPYRVFVSAGLLVYLASVTRLILSRPAATEFVHFVLPSACLVAFLLWNTWRKSAGASAIRFRRLVGAALPFLGGMFVPIAIFLLWYASQHALAAWWVGTFVRSTKHLHWVGWNAFSPAAGLLGLLPMLLILAGGYASRGIISRLAQIGTPLVLAGLLLFAWRSVAGYIFVGYSIALVVPLLAVAAPLCLRRSSRVDDGKRAAAFLCVAIAVVCALIQFPTSAMIYVCYVAPLIVLALAALLSIRPPRGRLAVASLLAFYLVFALWLRTPGYFNAMGTPPGRHVVLRRLKPAPGGGLIVESSRADEYNKLIPLIRAHARGQYIYCTPDCPQVYFLSGKRNPTGTLWDFLDPDFLDVPVRTERILYTVSKRGVNVVLLHHGRRVDSGPIAAGLRAALDKRFPFHETVGNFQVRWRASGGSAARPSLPLKTRTR